MWISCQQHIVRVKHSTSHTNPAEYMATFEEIRYLAVLIGRWVEEPDEDKSGKAQQRREPVRQLAQHLRAAASIRLTHLTS